MALSSLLVSSLGLSWSLHVVLPPFVGICGHQSTWQSLQVLRPSFSYLGTAFTSFFEHFTPKFEKSLWSSSMSLKAIFSFIIILIILILASLKAIFFQTLASLVLASFLRKSRWNYVGRGILICHVDDVLQLSRAGVWVLQDVNLFISFDVVFVW